MGEGGSDYGGRMSAEWGVSDDIQCVWSAIPHKRRSRPLSSAASSRDRSVGHQAAECRCRDEGQGGAAHFSSLIVVATPPPPDAIARSLALTLVCASGAEGWQPPGPAIAQGPTAASSQFVPATITSVRSMTGTLRRYSIILVRCRLSAWRDDAPGLNGVVGTK